MPKNEKNQKISTPRGEFYVRDNGKTGFPILLIHGWPQSSYCWESMLSHLQGDFRLIRPDTRGMGDSLRSLELEHYPKAELAKDIIGIADALQIEDFILIGHDWGGVIAQEVALAVPQRVKRLILMNISLINNPKGNLLARDALKSKGGYTFIWYQTFQQQPELAEAMIPGNEEVWLRHFLRFAKGRTFPPEALQEYVRTFQIPHTATTSANYYRSLYQDMQRWANLKTPFQMPGLYVYGYKDVVIIPEYLEYIEDCFAEGVELVRLEAGHFVQEELPQETAAAINEFLSDFEKI